MTDRTITVSADRPTGEGAARTEVRADSPSRSSTPEPAPRHTPLFVTRNEAYYWSREWQNDEAEALRELERGEGRVFHDPKEAVRWLRSPEN
jgi:hypothetical protein